MKSKLILFVLLGSLLVSCSKDENTTPDPIVNFSSQICANVNGPSAVYWDYAHGLATPLTQIPVIANPAGQFIHSQYPGLALTIPQGYNAVEVLIPETATLGVNLVRNDNQVVWRYVPTSTFQGNVGINDILGFEINTMFANLGFNGTPQVLCTTTQQGTVGGTFQSTFGARLIDFGNFRALVWANTLFEPSLNVTFTSLSVSVAPANEFDAVVMDTFLPFSFELLIIKDGVRDSDADGFPDQQDNFPFDPTRH